MSASEREPTTCGSGFEAWHPCLLLAGDYDTPLRPDLAEEFTIYARDPADSMTEWITADVGDVVDVEGMA